MRKFSLSAIAAVLMLAAPPPPVRAEGTGADIVYVFCKNRDHSKEMAAVCLSIFNTIVPALRDGARRGLTSAGAGQVSNAALGRALGFCPPTEYTIDQVTDIVIGHMKQFPKSQTASINETTMAALGRVWPCR